MQRDIVNRISIWEKVSDFLMDISKYVLTAVIITSAFEELADVRWMMYDVCSWSCRSIPTVVCKYIYYELYE